jgi:hypothetical protein
MTGGEKYELAAEGIAVENVGVRCRQKSVVRYRAIGIPLIV